MANTLTVLKVNILAGALETLSEEMTVAKLVNTNTDLSGATAQKGDTISFANPTVQTVGDVTPAATPPALVDTAVTETTVTLSNWKSTRFSVTDKEAAEMLNPQTFVNMQIAESARALGKQVNSDSWNCYKSVYGFVGTSGTNPFSSNINVIADAKKVLDDQLCPRGKRFAVYSHASEAAALKLGTFNTAYSRGNADALNKGELGDLYGFASYGDSQVPTHTAGTASGVLINSTTVAIGDTSVAIDTGTGTFVVGDIFTVAGDSQTYTVTTAVADVSAGTLAFSPTAKVAWANNAAVTKKATHEVNLAFDPGAFALALRAPSAAMPGMESEDDGMVMVEPKSGIPLRLDLIRGYHCWQVELSLLFGVKIIDPRRAVRIAG